MCNDRPTSHSLQPSLPLTLPPHRAPSSPEGRPLQGTNTGQGHGCTAGQQRHRHKSCMMSHMMSHTLDCVTHTAPNTNKLFVGQDTQPPTNLHTNTHRERRKYPTHTIVLSATLMLGSLASVSNMGCSAATSSLASSPSWVVSSIARWQSCSLSPPPPRREGHAVTGCDRAQRPPLPCVSVQHTHSF